MSRAATVFILLALLALPARADEDAASYFVDRGNKALASELYGDAEGHFNRALAECPGYLPALLGLAEVALGRGDEGLAAGRLETCVQRCLRGRRTASTSVVLKKAETLLRKVDRPRLEFRQAAESYAKDMMDLARRNEKTAPDLARRCIERVLLVCPDHEEAKTFRARLGGATEIELTTKGEELFNGKDLTGWTGGGAPRWTVSDGLLVARAPETTNVIRTEKAVEGDYTYRAEVRVAQDIGSSPLVGLCWGLQGAYTRWNLFLFNDKFTLVQFRGSDTEHQTFHRLLYYQFPGGFDRSAWNRLRVVVKGQRVTVHVNGKEAFHQDAPAGTLNGSLGFLIQESAAEIRNVRLIR